MKVDKTTLQFSLLVLAWGASYLFIRVAIQHGLAPLPLIALRLAIGAAIIWAVVLLRREPLRISRRHAAVLPLVATVNIALPFFLVAWGERTVASGLASVLNSTIPIFSVLLAGAVLRDEPVTLLRLSGVAVGFVGIIVLFSGDLLAGSRLSQTVGEASVVLSSVCYAVGAVLTRRLLRDLPPLTIATYSVTTAAVETGVLSVLFVPPRVGGLGLEGWLAVGWLGIMGSGVAYLLAFSILAAWGAARYTLVAYMLPLVGVTLGTIFLRERVSLSMLLGTALVIGGVVLASRVRHAAPGPAAAARPVSTGE